VYRLIGSLHTLGGLPASIAEFLRALDSLRKSIASRAGLTVDELRVMAVIAETDRATSGGLGASLDLTETFVAQVAGGLSERGFIAAIPSKSERGRGAFELTERGHSTMEAAYRSFQGSLTAAARPLELSDELAMIRSITLMTALLHSADPKSSL